MIFYIDIALNHESAFFPVF